MPKAKLAKNWIGMSIRVKGRVQGVGFRYFVHQSAVQANIVGWVRNTPDGDVVCEAEGDKACLEDWLRKLRQGPAMACVDDVLIERHESKGLFSEFSIHS